MSGDFKGEDYDDLAIGVPGGGAEGTGNVHNAGAVNVPFGSRSGLSSGGSHFWGKNSLAPSARATGDWFGATKKPRWTLLAMALPLLVPLLVISNAVPAKAVDLEDLSRFVPTAVLDPPYSFRDGSTNVLHMQNRSNDKNYATVTTTIPGTTLRLETNDGHILGPVTVIRRGSSWWATVGKLANRGRCVRACVTYPGGRSVCGKYKSENKEGETRSVKYCVREAARKPSRPSTGGSPSPRGKYWVDTFAEAAGYESPSLRSRRTGGLKTGTHYVYCRQKGDRVQVGSDYNTWWLKTDLDWGDPWKNQWVSAYYLKRWGNDVAKDNSGRNIPKC